MKKVYIVLTYSGTILSRLVKFYTKFNYPHVSIALKKDIKVMYSFGRKNVNNPFFGGFVVENKNGLFYKKFNKTKCIILEIEINKKQYNSVVAILKKYKDNIDIYRYDALGLFLKVFNIHVKRKNYSVCSEFVGYVLEYSDIYKFKNKIIKPMDFMNIPNTKILYEGNLLNY